MTFDRIKVHTFKEMYAQVLTCNRRKGPPFDKEGTEWVVEGDNRGVEVRIYR